MARPTPADVTVAHGTLPARDGRPLAATTYTGRDCDVVVLAGGTGIPRRFYDAFARDLASRGPTVLTFDYRGIGDSRRPGDLRDPGLRFRDWGQLDVDGVLGHAAVRFEGRLLYVGHSAGGQVLGLASTNPLVDRVVTVASQTGHWRYSPAPERYRLWLFWHVLFPSLTRAAGYLPASRLGMGEDLPLGVIREWTRWCRDRAYLFGDPTLDTAGFARLTAPVRAIDVADDPWATAAAVDDLHGHYANAIVDRVQVSPDEVGRSSLGHLGFFRADAAPLWDHVGAWLLAPSLARR